MPQIHNINSIPAIHLLVAALYFICAVINAASRGWQDTSWVGWILMAIGFILLGRLPEHVRRSLRETSHNAMGIVATATFVIGIVLLWLRLRIQ